MKTNPLTIGVDASCWTNRRGFGRFTRELLTALLRYDQTNRYVFVTDSATAAVAANGIPFPENAEVIEVKTDVAPSEAASGSGRRSVKDLWRMSRAASARRFDAFFFPAVYSYFPVLGSPICVTVHDLIADNHPTLVFPEWRLKMFWKLKQNLAIRQARRILTVSEYSRGEILRFYHLPERRVALTTEGPHSAFRPLAAEVRILEKHGIPINRPFFIHIGGFSPHKNLAVLAEAFADIDGANLVLAGDYRGDSFHSGYEPLRRRIDELGITDRVVFPGYVPDEELAVILNVATALVFPSLEEGFGLPAVEAMACGTPVLASDRGSLPEIVGEAGLFFGPNDGTSLSGLMTRLLVDAPQREAMARASLERARQFTWEKAARSTLACLLETANRSSP